MKKLLFAAIAIVAMTACANEDVVRINRQEISFGEAFVESATRADYSSTNINQFTVYGTVTGNNNTVSLFGGDGATVTRGTAQYGQAWSCNEAEYWIPVAEYHFQAVVDGVINNGTITYSVGQDTDNDNVSDLLYATANATTDDTATPTGDLSNGNVAFSFSHLLSKVGFTFVNGVSGSTDYTFQVKSVSFTGHDSEGTYTIGSGWDDSVSSSTAALNFGVPTDVVTTTNSVAAPTTHQIIPGEQTLNVTVLYDILYKGQNVSPNRTVTKDLTHTFEQNTVYNINVTLPAPGQRITFTVNRVGDWANGGDVDLDRE